jgi:hypothetical protein
MCFFGEGGVPSLLVALKTLKLNIRRSDTAWCHVTYNDVSKEYMASIFKVEEQVEHETYRNN